MDKAQLKLYGSVQLVNANFVGEHPEYRQAEFRCPVCFERVRWIVREIASGQTQYFAHGRQQNALPGSDICELRTKSIPGFASYIKSRLPLYLTQTLGVFQLNIGLPGLDDRVLELAKSLNLGVEIKAANQLSLDLKKDFDDRSLVPSTKNQVIAQHIQVASLSSEKFRPLQRTLIPLDFIPRFDYSSKQQQQLSDLHLRLVCFHPQLPEILTNAESADFVKHLVDIIHDEWSILVDGFGPCGAFFHYGTQMGRQVKRGAILVPGVKYYLVTTENYQLPDFIRVIDSHNNQSFHNYLGKFHLREVSAKIDFDNSDASYLCEKPSAAQAAWQAALAQQASDFSENMDDGALVAESNSTASKDSSFLQDSVQSSKRGSELNLVPSYERGHALHSVQVYQDAPDGKKVFSSQTHSLKQLDLQEPHVSLVVRLVYISPKAYKLHAADIERRLNQDFCLYVDTPSAIKPLWPPVLNQESVIPVKSADKVFCGVKGIAFKPEVYREISNKQSEALHLESVAGNPQAHIATSTVQLFNKGVTSNFTMSVPLGCDRERQQVLKRQYAKLERLSLAGHNVSSPLMQHVDDTGAVYWSVYPTSISWGIGESLTFQNAKVEHTPLKYELSFVNAWQQRMNLPWRTLSNALQSMIAAKSAFIPALASVPANAIESVNATVPVNATAPATTQTSGLEVAELEAAHESEPASNSKPEFAADVAYMVSAESGTKTNAKSEIEAKDELGIKVAAKPEFKADTKVNLPATLPRESENKLQSSNLAMPQYLANFMASLSQAQTVKVADTANAVNAVHKYKPVKSVTPTQAAQRFNSCMVEKNSASVSKFVPDIQAMDSLAQKTAPAPWCCKLQDNNLGFMRTSTALQVVTLDAHASVLDDRRLMPKFTYGVMRDKTLSHSVSSMWVLAFASHYRNAASILFAASCPPTPVPAFNWTGQTLEYSAYVENSFEVLSGTHQNTDTALGSHIGPVQPGLSLNESANPLELTSGTANQTYMEPGLAKEGAEIEPELKLHLGDTPQVRLEPPISLITDDCGLTNDITQHTGMIGSANEAGSEFGSEPGLGLNSGLSTSEGLRNTYKFDVNALLQKWGPRADASIGFALENQQGIDAESQSAIERYPFDQSAEEIKLENQWLSQFCSAYTQAECLILAPAWIREVVVRCRYRHWLLLSRLLEQQVISGKVALRHIPALWNLRQYLMGLKNFNSELGLCELEQSLSDSALENDSTQKSI